MAATHVAFLRGMNVGGHRITNPELTDHVAALGFGDVATFQASGNVVFDAGTSAPSEVEARLEDGLAAALGYEVPTVVRSLDRVATLATADPFDGWVGDGTGKLQVAVCRPAVAAEVEARLRAMLPPGERLAVDGADVFWQPAAGVLDSTFDPQKAATLVEVWTMRTQGTLQRLVKKFGG